MNANNQSNASETVQSTSVNAANNPAAQQTPAELIAHYQAEVAKLQKIESDRIAAEEKAAAEKRVAIVRALPAQLGFQSNGEVISFIKSVAAGRNVTVATRKTAKVAKTGTRGQGVRLNDEENAALKKAMAAGLTVSEARDKFGISTATYYNKQKEWSLKGKSKAKRGRRAAVQTANAA